uniref:Uncharacterized protein n=1 Tax=Anguilla anguilla TaxID=7936 RepID=A0A0E9VMH3_ANGAN
MSMVCGGETEFIVQSEAEVFHIVNQLNCLSMYYGCGGVCLWG